MIIVHESSLVVRFVLSFNVFLLIVLSLPCHSLLTVIPQLELKRVPSIKLVCGSSSGFGPTHLRSNLILESLESLLTAWVESEPCELRG